MSTAWLDKLVWVLIYGGLLVLGLGLAVLREASPWGLGLVIGGGVGALIGFVLIAVRSRRREP